jgi:small subunit ribosomal protein S21
VAVRAQEQDGAAGCGEAQRVSAEGHAVTNAVVILTPGMDVEQACKRLKKALTMNGTMKEMKKRAAYLKPSVKRRRKQAEARKRERKAARKRESYLARYEDA